MQDMQRRLDTTFYAVVALPSTAMGFALSVQIMALSWLLATKYHLNIDEIGIVWAAGPIAGIVGQMVFGLISDKTWFLGGRRRPFILIGGALVSVALFLLPHIDIVAHLLGVGDMLIVAAALAMLLDLSINISFNPTRSLIADVTPEGAPRTRGYAWMQTISGFWGVMAYLIGAYWGNDVLIGVGSILVLLFSVAPMFFIEETQNVQENASAVKIGAATVDWRQLLCIYVAHGFSWLGAQTMFVYVIAFVQQHLIPPTASTADAATQSGQIIGISFAVMSTVGFLLPSLALAPLANKIGRVRTQVGCVTLMAIGYFFIAFCARTPTTMYALMAIVGIGWGAIVSLPFAIMSEKVGEHRMGLFMGIFNLSVVLPQLFASLALGKLILIAPEKNIIFLISGVSLMMSALVWRYVKEERSSKICVNDFRQSRPGKMPTAATTPSI